MQWGVTIGSIYFNSIDIIVFSLAVIAGIVGTLVGFAKAFSHHSGFIVGFFSGLMFTKMVAEVIVQSFYLPPLLASLVAWVVSSSSVTLDEDRPLETALPTGLRQVKIPPRLPLGAFELAIIAPSYLSLNCNAPSDLSSVLDRQFVLNGAPLVPRPSADHLDYRTDHV